MTYTAQDHPRIGWIGTGRMGFQLAARLLDAGHDVAVYNRTRTKAEPLAERGAAIVDRPADLADRDVVFTMVSASPDLQAVTTGPGGVLTSPDAAPKALVDSSTVSTQTSALIRAAAAERGTDFLAAPVSGNPQVIAAGKLTIAVSGSHEVFDQVEPLLALLGRGVTYVGEDEVARLVKIAHNVFLGVVTQSLAEITVLAEKGGVSRAAFLEFLNGSVLGSTYTRYKSPHDGQPGLHADIHHATAAQGLRSGAVRSSRPGGPDAARRRHRSARRECHRGRACGGGLRGPDP